MLLRLLITAASLYVATRIVPGISYTGGVLGMLGVALVFGIVNTFVGNILKLLALPVVILTLGLFIFVINALMLMLTSSMSSSLGLNFHVAGFVPALLGSLVITLAGTILSIVLTPKNEQE